MQWFTMRTIWPSISFSRCYRCHFNWLSKNRRYRNWCNWHRSHHWSYSHWCHSGSTHLNLIQILRQIILYNMAHIIWIILFTCVIDYSDIWWWPWRDSSVRGPCAIIYLYVGLMADIHLIVLYRGCISRSSGTVIASRVLVSLKKVSNSEENMIPGLWTSKSLTKNAMGSSPSGLLVTNLKTLLM